MGSRIVASTSSITETAKSSDQAEIDMRMSSPLRRECRQGIETQTKKGKKSYAAAIPNDIHERTSNVNSAAEVRHGNLTSARGLLDERTKTTICDVQYASNGASPAEMAAYTLPDIPRFQKSNVAPPAGLNGKVTKGNQIEPGVSTVMDATRDQHERASRKPGAS